MAAQDDAREKQMRDLFNLRVDPDRGRSDTDAYLDRPNVDPVPFELKSTTKTSISTVRDFSPDHVRKWQDKHWLFGFFDQHEELQYCCYASPAMMKPWIDTLQGYVRPDLELAARLGSRVTEDDLIAILGDKDVYSPSDALSVYKKQWSKQQYFDAMDVLEGYTHECLVSILPKGVTEGSLVRELGDKDIYSLAEIKVLLKKKWRNAMIRDVAPGYTKQRMLAILQERAKYLLARGATLNNPHISKKFFEGFEKITANHAMRVREMVAEAEEYVARGITPEEAALMQEAAAKEIPSEARRSGSTPDDNPAP